MSSPFENLMRSVKEREHPVGRLESIEFERAGRPFRGHFPGMTHEDLFGLVTFVKGGEVSAVGDGGILDEARWTVEVQNGEIMKVLQEE